MGCANSTTVRRRRLASETGIQSQDSTQGIYGEKLTVGQGVQLHLFANIMPQLIHLSTTQYKFSNSQRPYVKHLERQKLRPLPICNLALKIVHYIFTPNMLRSYIQNSLRIFSFSCSFIRGTRWRSWKKHCATNQKVAGSIPDEVIGIFH